MIVPKVIISEAGDSETKDNDYIIQAKLSTDTENKSLNFRKNAAKI